MRYYHGALVRADSYDMLPLLKDGKPLVAIRMPSVFASQCRSG